jgi:lactate dehydrogenase-like 2-hydroxyacid dehydrogenase
MTSADRARVIVAAPLPPDLMAVLRNAFDVQELPAAAKDTAALAAALANAEGFLLSESVAVAADLLDRCPHLRVISKVGVGYDRIDVTAATARNILVCNTPGVLNWAVADHTFAILLALTRRLRENEARVRSGEWTRGAELLGRDIRAKTLGILGFGGIARTVASTARGFDMKVIYYRRTRDRDAEASGLAAFRKRDNLFREADVVTVHCPLTSETRRSIGEREFKLMKPSAYFRQHVARRRGRSGGARASTRVRENRGCRARRDGPRAAGSEESALRAAKRRADTAHRERHG